MIDIDISNWFTEEDSGDSIVVTMGMSDGGDNPSWLAMESMRMVGMFDSLNFTSELINLKFIAIDKFGGSNYLNK